MPQTLHEIYQTLFDIFLEFIFNWVSFICIYQIQQPHSEQMQPHTRADAWWAKCGLNANSQLSLDLVHILFTNCTTKQVILDYKLFEGRYNVSFILYFYSVEQMLIKHRFYKVIFQTCMSKEIFLDGEKNLPIALPWNLIQTVTIYLRQPWSHWHSSIMSSYWKHNTELNARWVSKDNCERHETLSHFSS